MGGSWRRCPVAWLGAAGHCTGGRARACSSIGGGGRAEEAGLTRAVVLVVVAAAAVAALRGDLATAFMEQGAVSFQLGKFYRYQEGLEPTAAGLLRELKALLDPDGRMNPGALGL